MSRIAFALFAAISTVGTLGCSSKPAGLPGQPNLFVGDAPDGGVAADYSCNGKRVDPAAPTTDTVVTGTIKDFQDDNLVSGAVISVYATADQVLAKMPIATSMPSDAMGNYTVTVPKGYYRVIFGNTGGKALSNGNPVDTIDTYEFNRKYDDKGRTAVKVSTREAIPGLVSVIPDTSLGVLAGAVRDCNEKEVGGARVTISDTSGPYMGDMLTFYFKKISGSTLPTRTQKWTDGNGAFAALNVPVGKGTVSAKGIITTADGEVDLGSGTVPVLAGSITLFEVLPKSSM
jgi:hypothetical protein